MHVRVCVCACIEVQDSTFGLNELTWLSLRFQFYTEVSDCLLKHGAITRQKKAKGCAYNYMGCALLSLEIVILIR